MSLDSGFYLALYLGYKQKVLERLGKAEAGLA